jgi:tetratricopeptide (TPR) repeat protein
LSGALTNVGNTLGREGRLQDAGEAHDEAIAIKEKLASAFPKNSDYQSELGASLNNRVTTLRDKAAACQILRKAIAHQEAALEAQPKNPTYRRFLWYHYANLTNDLVELGDHREAAKAAAELARVSPDRARDSFFAAGFLARCATCAEGDPTLSATERTALARSYAGQAREILKDVGNWAPDDAGFLNSVAWLLVSGPDPQLYESARALALADMAVKLAPKNAAYWFNLGVARFRVGNAQGAIEALEKVMSLRTDGNAKGGFMLAMAYWKLGERSKAIDWYSRAAAMMLQTGWTDEESCRFQAEAAALLGLADLPADVFAQP